MTVALAVALVFVGATVHPGDGDPIEGATVVVQEGRITALGVGVPIPEAAAITDAKGKVITPGLVDPWTALGASEIHGVARSNDRDAGGADPVRAAFRVVDVFDPHSQVIPVQRAYGITAVGVAPRGGLVAGQLGAFALRADEAPLRRFAGLAVTLGGQREGSRGVAVTQLRALLDDARLYRQDPKAFAPHRFGHPRVSRLDLDAVARVIAGEAPLFVTVHRRADIRAALALAAEQEVGLVLVGATEAWAEAQAIAAAKVPVILNPLENLPGDFDRRLATAAAAARLSEAGVTVALSTFETHNVRTLRQVAGNAVRAGLPHGEAVRAITAHPGQALGVPGLGTLAVGGRADLVLWSGDPLELSSRAEQVLVGGQVMPQANRQRALLNRYRKLPLPR